MNVDLHRLAPRLERIRRVFQWIEFEMNPRKPRLIPQTNLPQPSEALPRPAAEGIRSPGS